MTSKSLPFELRDWDAEYFESLDPTDSFGSTTRVYIKDNQVIQIEPNYNVFTYDLWITDKGRQFFDSIYDAKKRKGKNSKPLLKNPFKKISNHSINWSFTFKKLIHTVYFFDFYNNDKMFKKTKKCIIIFENVGLEILSLLSLLKNNFSFLSIKKSEKHNVSNDFESSFQLNSSSSKAKLNFSTFCLIVNTNLRYEGYYLNLYLKNRMSKGNFECFSLSSVINLTYFNSFLGSTTTQFKKIIEGNHFLCQKLKSKKNPCLILNSELFSRTDFLKLQNIIEVLKYSSIISQNWNGINVLNYSLFENGNYATNKFSTLKTKDFLNFNILYFLNTGSNNLFVTKKLTESKLLNFDAKVIGIKNYEKFSKNLHTSTFFEKEETFVNTTGVFCRTTKLVSQQNHKSSWQILRKMLSTINHNLVLLNIGISKKILVNFNSLNYFKDFINFFFFAAVKISNLGFFLNKKTKSFVFFKNNYKPTNNKIFYTKFVFWLENFFTGGKDEYSHESSFLSLCSDTLKAETTTFF